MKEILLSFEKFAELAAKYNYAILYIFTLDDRVRILQLQTPKYSKTFLINIPEKYHMNIPSSFDGNTSFGGGRKEIFPYELSSKRPLDIIKSYKMEGLATISSTMICLYHNSQSIECFTIGKSHKVQKKKDEEIMRLEKETREVLGRVGETIKEKKEFLKPEDIKHMAVYDTPSTSELVFAEEDGTIIEKGSAIEQMAVAATGGSHTISEKSKMYVEPIIPQKEPKSSSNSKSEVVKPLAALTQPKEEEKDEEDEENFLEQEEIDTEPNISINVLPSEIELKNIINGALYVMVNINYFFTNASAYEGELFVAYEKIIARDEQLRTEKVVDISRVLEEIKNKILLKFQSLSMDEKDIKESLEKCSRMLLTCMNVKEKISRKKILKEELPKVCSLEKETRLKVDALNLSLLEKRDELDLFLDETKQFFDEYIAEF